MVSYCSSSNDRLLTKVLLKSSNCSSKSFHRFVNSLEWVDGLDVWSSSSSEIRRKNEIYRRNLDFSEDVGLYLPRSAQLSCTPIPTPIKSDLKGTNNNLFPERLRQLFQKEKDSLIETDLKINRLPSEQLSISEENQSSNSFQKSNSNEIYSNKLRFPLRPVESNHSSRENKSKQSFESINRDNFQSILKEQFSSLFIRETTNLSSKRSVIKIPSVEIKHQNLPPRTIPTSDPTLIMERYAKLQQLLLTPTTVNHSNLNNKLIDHRQSPLFFQGISNLGLTVTPLDFSSSKHLQNSSSEKMFQEENSLSTTRPSTQPVLLPSSIHQNDEQQRNIFKGNIETKFISSSGDFVSSNKNSINEQEQTIKRFHRHHRSFAKTSTRRSQTFQLLPHISGKRIHGYVSNQRNS